MIERKENEYKATEKIVRKRKNGGRWKEYKLPQIKRNDEWKAKP